MGNKKELKFILNGFLEELEEACHCFKETAQYLRRRRECLGRENFDKGVKILDRAVLEMKNKVHGEV